jgi:hypothetical protein
MRAGREYRPLLSGSKSNSEKQEIKTGSQGRGVPRADFHCPNPITVEMYPGGKPFKGEGM